MTGAPGRVVGEGRSSTRDDALHFASGADCARKRATFFVAQCYLNYQMKRALSVSRCPVWRLRLLATVLAVVGQMGISGASLTLARDESSVVSHTERNGVDLHHGHNEATCAACTALSFHATVNPGALPVSERGDRSLRSRPLFGALRHRSATPPQLLPSAAKRILNRSFSD